MWKEGKGVLQFGHVYTLIMRLRQACDHIYLVKKSFNYKINGVEAANQIWDKIQKRVKERDQLGGEELIEDSD